MGFFSDNIKGATDSGGGNYITPGIHTLEVKEMKFFKNHQKKDVWVVEFVVRETDPNRAVFEEQRRQIEAKDGPYASSSPYVGHTLGQSVSIVEKPTSGEFPGMSQGRMKTFIEVLAGDKAAELDDDDFDAMCGDAQIAAGALVRCEAYDKANKNETKMITAFKWALIRPSPDMGGAVEG